MGVTGAAGDRARETVDHIARYCASSLPRQLSLLERLVNIDSGSGDEAGLRRMITAMEEQWRRLGFQGAIVETATGPQLTAERPSPHGEAPRVLLIGHVDTVFPAGTAQARPFSVEGGRAYGPGVADMKGGLVTMLGAVDALRRVGALDRLHVTVIHNCDEETGSHGSRPIVEEEARGCHAVLVFEPGRPDGSIVHQRKGQLQYVLKLKGRAAHAGVAPEQGARRRSVGPQGGRTPPPHRLRGRRRR